MTKYEYNHEIYDTLEEAEDALQYFIDENLDDMIDEDCEEYTIFGMTYSASQILREVDPIAYRCISNDYFDVMYDDIYEIDVDEE